MAILRWTDVGPMLTNPRPHFHQLPTWAQRILAIWDIVVFQAAPDFLSSRVVDSLSRTLEGNFSVGLTCAIFFPRPLPGLGDISNFIFIRNKLTKVLCSQYHCNFSN